MGGFFVTILQYLYILNVFIFPCSPFWLTCNVNIVVSSKVMLLSLCLHYTWLYYLYHICFLLFFWILQLYDLWFTDVTCTWKTCFSDFSRDMRDLRWPRPIHVSTGDHPSGCHTCTKSWDNVSNLSPYHPYIYLHPFLHVLCDADENPFNLLFLTFNSLCKPNNIIFKIFHFRWGFFLQIYRKKH